MRIVDDDGRQYRSKVEAACNGSAESSYYIEEPLHERIDITDEVARLRQGQRPRGESLSEIPKGNDIVLPPCPSCGGVLRLEFRFKTKIVALAGTQMKLGATQWPYLVCDDESCDFIEEGKMT